MKKRELPAVPNIFIAGGYKTGSTHIGLSLHRLTGLRKASCVATRGSIGDEEQRIDRPAADILFPMGGLIFQNHIRGSVSNLEILQEHGIRPIIVGRNVLDSLVSIRNRFNEVAVQAWRAQPSKGWHKMTEDQQWRWLTYNVSPWFMAFYSSWYRAEIDKCYVWYEQHFKDQVKSLRSVLTFTGLLDFAEVSDEAILSCCDHTDGNLSSGPNAGQSGRGRREIPGKWIDVIADQARAWGKEFYRNALGGLVQ